METLIINPIFASGALEFAFKQATTEGKITIGVLILVSIFSWTVIITKARQLIVARRMGKKFFAAYRESRDPLALVRAKREFDGAPAYELYMAGAEEIQYHLKHNAIEVPQSRGGGSNAKADSAPMGKDGAVVPTAKDTPLVPATSRVSSPSFDSVRLALERAAGVEAMALEKGMIILTTAVAGGPFIGLLGTVWGVMETFCGIARAGAANLAAMAPGVAGALIATVVGLLVAIPAMFAYNYMVTTVRSITQEMDGFASEYATQLEHQYVDNRALADEIRDALQISSGSNHVGGQQPRSPTRPTASSAAHEPVLA